MRMYSEKFSKIAWFRIWTYDEVLVVENGYTEVNDDHPNSIAILKTPRKGSFVEVPGVPEVLPGAESVETETIEVETPEGETAETKTIEVEVTETVATEEEMPKPMTFELDESSEEEKGDEQSQAEPPAEETALTAGDVEVLVTKSGSTKPGSRRRTGAKRKK